MVQRNDLTDLLIAPMQHQCHYQLLLEVTSSFSLWGLSSSYTVLAGAECAEGYLRTLREVTTHICYQSLCRGSQ